MRVGIQALLALVALCAAVALFGFVVPETRELIWIGSAVLFWAAAVVVLFRIDARLSRRLGPWARLGLWTAVLAAFIGAGVSAAPLRGWQGDLAILVTVSPVPVWALSLLSIGADAPSRAIGGAEICRVGLGLRLALALVGVVCGVSLLEQARRPPGDPTAAAIVLGIVVLALAWLSFMRIEVTPEALHVRGGDLRVRRYAWRDLRAVHPADLALPAELSFGPAGRVRIFPFFGGKWLVDDARRRLAEHDA